MVNCVRVQKAALVLYGARSSQWLYRVREKDAHRHVLTAVAACDRILTKRMRYHQTIISVFIVGGCLMMIGCRVGDVSHEPGLLLSRSQDVILAAYFGEEDLIQATGEQDKADTATQAQSPDPPDDRKSKQVPYTQPSRRRTFLTIVAERTVAVRAAGTNGTNGTNGSYFSSDEIANTVGFGAFGPASLQPSLTPTDTIALSAGRVGLQQGAPLLGGSPVNIFMPRANPITPRCGELVAAGFFADTTGCSNHFGR